MYNCSHHEREEEMKIPKSAYTAEFKELEVTRVKDGMTAGAAAKKLGRIEQALRNWVKTAVAGRLNGAGAKVVTPEQMELSRLHAEIVRLKRENEIQKKQWQVQAINATPSGIQWSWRVIVMGHMGHPGLSAVQKADLWHRWK
jgi:transposase